MRASPPQHLADNGAGAAPTGVFGRPAGCRLKRASTGTLASRCNGPARASAGARSALPSLLHRCRRSGATAAVAFHIGTRDRAARGRFAAGDHIVVKRNDPRRELVNGDRRQIIAVDPERERVTARFDDRVIVLDAAFLHDRTQRGDPTIAHAYAVTCHTAQGITVRRWPGPRRP
jgi:hypothetical protein